MKCQIYEELKSFRNLPMGQPQGKFPRIFRKKWDLLEENGKKWIQKLYTELVITLPNKKCAQAPGI